MDAAAKLSIKVQKDTEPRGKKSKSQRDQRPPAQTTSGGDATRGQAHDESHSATELERFRAAAAANRRPVPIPNFRTLPRDDSAQDGPSAFDPPQDYIRSEALIARLIDERDDNTACVDYDVDSEDEEMLDKLNALQRPEDAVSIDAFERAMHGLEVETRLRCVLRVMRVVCALALWHRGVLILKHTHTHTRTHTHIGLCMSS